MEKQYPHQVFLGGIPALATHADVEEGIRSLRALSGRWYIILKGKKGQNNHLGFGFLHLESESDIDGLLSQQIKLYVLGKEIECKKAWSVNEHKSKTHHERLKKLYVSCLKKSTKKEDILGYFSEFGSVKDVTNAKDPKTGRNLGFCIVEFNSAESLQNAISRTEHFIQGKNVKVQQVLLRHELKSQSRPNGS